MFRICLSVPCSSCSPPPGQCCHPEQHSPDRCDPPGWVSAGCSTGQPWGRSTPPTWHPGGKNLEGKRNKKRRMCSNNHAASVYHTLVGPGTDTVSAAKYKRVNTGVRKQVKYRHFGRSETVCFLSWQVSGSLTPAWLFLQAPSFTEASRTLPGLSIDMAHFAANNLMWKTKFNLPPQTRAAKNSYIFLQNKDADCTKIRA